MFIFTEQSHLEEETSAMKGKKNSAASAAAAEEEEGSSETNRPRNFLVRDATKAFEYSFLQYGKPAYIVVEQTAQDETWPGGALWDIGVILSSFFVELAGFQSTKKEISNKKIPPRILQAIPNIKDLSVLELGCGVGLTGIVAAAVLGTELTILTDLDVVVEKVTETNVELNSTPSVVGNGGYNPYRLTKAGKRGRIMAMPLSWGSEKDEDAVLECFRKWTKPQKLQRKKKGKNNEQPQTVDTGQPDLIIIGDVAYQHYPGAPSHFDILLSTLLRFLGPNTIVVFGTRMRMAASADLLDMFREHMEEIASPPIKADEIDPTFSKFKHQITIHIMKKRQQKKSEL